MEVGEPWGPEGFRGVISRLIWELYRINSLSMVNFVVNFRVFFCSKEIGSDWGRSNSS